MTDEPMTRQEIIDQAQVGGFAIGDIVRLQGEVVGLKSAHGDAFFIRREDGYLLELEGFDREFFQVVKPPPLTIKQQLANALAEIERLKGINASIMAEKSVFPASEPQDPNPWRDHDGGDMPCNGDLMVDVGFVDGFNAAIKADNVSWKGTGNFYNIIRWRPHKEEGQ